MNPFLKFLQDTADQLKNQGARLLKSGNMERTVKVIAIMAYWPDREASQPEIRRGLKALNEFFGEGFDIAQALKKVNDEIDKLKGDFGDIYYDGILADLKKVRDPEDAKFFLRIAAAIGKADGAKGEDPFSREEKREVCVLAKTMGVDPSFLGLDPSDYGL